MREVKLHSCSLFHPLLRSYIPLTPPSKCTSTVNNLNDEVSSVRSTVKQTKLWRVEFINPWQLQAGFKNNCVDDRLAGERTRAPFNEAASLASSSPLRKGQASTWGHLPGSGAFPLLCQGDCRSTAHGICPVQLTCITVLMMRVTEKRFQPQESP